MEFVDYNGNDIPLLNEFPIGTVLITVTNSNPSNFTTGTWISFGTGRTIVGIDTSQTEFNTVEKTGGSNTFDLNLLTVPSAYGFVTGGVGYGGKGIINESQGFGNYITKKIDTIQPYITVYMWKRTA